jgi:hypothetical protein
MSARYLLQGFSEEGGDCQNLLLVKKVYAKYSFMRMSYYCRDTSIGSTKILLRLKVKNPPIVYTIDTIDTIMTHKILLGTMEVFLLYVLLLLSAQMSSSKCRYQGGCQIR